jgi:hypothetical protein
LFDHQVMIEQWNERFDKRLPVIANPILELATGLRGRSKLTLLYQTPSVNLFAGAGRH